MIYASGGSGLFLSITAVDSRRSGHWYQMRSSSLVYEEEEQEEEDGMSSFVHVSDVTV